MKEFLIVVGRLILSIILAVGLNLTEVNNFNYEPGFIVLFLQCIVIVIGMHWLFVKLGWEKK